MLFKINKTLVNTDNFFEMKSRFRAELTRQTGGISTISQLKRIEGKQLANTSWGLVLCGVRVRNFVARYVK